MVGILDKDSPYCDKTDTSLSTAVGTTGVHPNPKLTVKQINSGEVSRGKVSNTWRSGYGIAPSVVFPRNSYHDTCDSKVNF